MKRRPPARGRARPPATVSLDRALSKLGLASRTEARALILAGRVELGGVVVRDPGRAVVPERAQLRIDGAPVRAPERLTIMLHKPRGVVTTRDDEAGRQTVYAFLDVVPQKVMPVGRLDLATSGLLLLTNDSRLGAYLTDPQNQIARVYLVTVRGELDDEAAARMRRGVHDAGERLAASQVTVRKRSGRETHLVVELHEGKNREIRRLCEAVGHEVTALKRVAFGALELGELEPGKWRVVNDAELRRAFPRAPQRG